MTGADTALRSREATRATIAGLAVNIVLVAAKFAAGIVGSSSALIADAIHSLSDTVTDIALIASFRFVDRPADREHRHGHGKIETLAAAFCGVMLAAAAIGIIHPAASRIKDAILGEDIGGSPGAIALAAALASVFFKEGLFRYTMAVGRRLGSSALIANAWHHRSDAMSSVATAVGVGAAISLGPRFAVLDPIAALLVGAFILRAAWSILWQSGQELIEASIGPEGEAEIASDIRSHDGVRDCHAIRSRRIGPYIAIEAHVLVDGSMTVVDSHAIASEVERSLREKFGPRTETNIHVEPYGGADR